SDGGGDVSTGYDPFDPFAVPTQTQEAETADAPSNEVPFPVDNGSLTMTVDPTPAFWIYFPEARHVFVNKEVMNRHNDATGLSYDDVFIKRLFSSYIVKQSSTDDLR